MTHFSIEDYGLSAYRLADKYNPDGDGEHPTYSRRGWRSIVEQDATLLGYWEWVRHQLEEEQDELDRDSPYYTELPE